MEVISGGASVLAFITVALQSTKVIHQLLSGIKDAPDHVNQVFVAINHLQTVLQQLSTCPTLGGTAQDGMDLKPLKDLLKTCRDDVSRYEAAIKKSLGYSGDKSSISFWKKVSVTLQEKRFQNMLSILRLHATELTLQLNLLQRHKLENISDRIKIHANRSESNTTLLEQQSESFTNLKGDLSSILGFMQKVVGDSSAIKSLLEKIDNELNKSSIATGSATIPSKIQEILESDTLDDTKLSESIERLCQMVNRENDFVDGDELDIIQNDLQMILQSAIKDTKMNESSTSAMSRKYLTEETVNGVERKDLYRFQTLLRSSPSIAINQAVKRKASTFDDTIVEYNTKSQKYDIARSSLMVHTQKRRRMLRVSEEYHLCSRKLDEFVATVTVIPQTVKKRAMIKAIIHQREFPSYISLVPSLIINPILPADSEVFELARTGSVERLLELVIAGKASFKDHDQYGASLLHYAVGQPEMCKTLLRQGIDPNEIAGTLGCEKHDENYQLTPLQMIINDTDYSSGELKNMNECRKLMLLSGADPSLNVQVNDNCSFFEAAYAGSLENLELHLSLGNPFIHIEFNFGYGMTPLLKASELVQREEDAKRISYLLRNGADVNAKNIHGWNCLFILLQWMHERSPGQYFHTCLKEMIQAGADVYSVSNHGLAICCAAYKSPFYELPKSGSYVGDLFDSVLAELGYDVSTFRRGHPRRAHYTASYSRADFEKLWEGIEELCPYYDDIEDNYSDCNACSFCETSDSDEESLDEESTDEESMDEETMDEETMDEESMDEEDTNVKEKDAHNDEIFMGSRSSTSTSGSARVEDIENDSPTSIASNPGSPIFNAQRERVNDQNNGSINQAMDTDIHGMSTYSILETTPSASSGIIWNSGPMTNETDDIWDNPWAEIP